VTPGNAKPRSELPWLPYRTQDKVFVINSHNFGPAVFDPSVNGKMPIAAWVPTRTQNADDFFGVNNGTLTNGASIVADTGAGGTDAFSFDGVNDRVTTGFASGTVTEFAASVWARQSSLTINKAIFGWWSGSQGIFVQTGINNATRLLFLAGGGNQYSETPISSFAANQWLHLVLTYNGSIATPDNRISVYIDGVLQSLTNFGNGIASSINAASATFSIGDASTLGRHWNGLIDDVRIWNQSLNATDVAALYAAQRGGQA
jgi:hypothetical protein